MCFKLSYFSLFLPATHSSYIVFALIAIDDSTLHTNTGMEFNASIRTHHIKINDGVWTEPRTAKSNHRRLAGRNKGKEEEKRRKKGEKKEKRFREYTTVGHMKPKIRQILAL